MRKKSFLTNSTWCAGWPTGESQKQTMTGIFSDTATPIAMVDLRIMVFVTITTYFKTNGSEYLWSLCHIFWTQMSEKSIKDRNGILDHSLRFSFQLICKDLPSGKFQRYISNQQSKRDLPIFLQFLDLASNCDTSWSISRSKPWSSRCDRVFSGSGIFWSHFPLIARDI